MTDTNAGTVNTPAAPAPDLPPEHPKTRSVRGIATGALGEGANLIVWGAIIVSLLVTLCFAAVSLMIIGVLKTPLSDGNATTLNSLYSSLIVLQTTVVNYWCGSSSGSARKDHVQAAVLTSAPPPTSLTTGDTK